MLDTHDDLVLPEHACPTCGERHPDQLVWHEPPDEERVECQRCKTVYEPGGQRHDD